MNENTPLQRGFFTEAAGHARTKNGWRILTRCLAMGGLCLPVGGGVCTYIQFASFASGFSKLMTLAPLAAFLAGFVLWTPVAWRPGPRRGLLVGAAVGALWPWVSWCMVMVPAIGDLLGSGFRETLGLPALDLHTALFWLLWGGAIYSMWSLVLFGALTIPVCAGIGYFLGRRQAGVRSSL